MANPVRRHVFVSYSHDDAKWWERLRKVLAPMIRTEPNAIWWDGFIEAGQKWREEIERALGSARVGLLLVSPNFLASEFILNVELPSILDAAEKQGVRVLWCLVRNCWYQKTPIVEFQAVHNPRMAWNSLGEAELDALLVEIASKIEAALRSDLVVSSEGERSKTPTYEAPGLEPAVIAGAAVTASVPLEPRRVVDVALESAPDVSQSRSAERLLKDIEDLRTVDEIGDLFVLRRKWSDAEFTYNRMIQLAAPHKELWMAQGYEKLGLVRLKQEKWKAASECLRLAKTLYHRTGKVEKVAELGQRLLDIQAPQAAPPAREPRP